MEVRPDILKKLLCSVCGEYMSCAPIRMTYDGAVLCGRCCDLEDKPTLRITLYEDLAEMLVFPCANKTHGCTETFYMAEIKDHEEECEYRQYVCPVAESGQCDWSGSRKNILDHCKEQHRDKILQGPHTIKHQINENNRKTFLLAAFEMLFIVHCKVCIISKNIYHSVHLIGKSAHAKQYRFKLEVSNNNDTFIRRSDVAPQGCMSLQEDTSVCVDINTILKYLGDFKDVIFKIKVGRKCVKCNKCVQKSAWPTDEGWCCEVCAPARHSCELVGCLHSYIDIKTDIHKLLHLYLTIEGEPPEESGVMRRAPVVNIKKDIIIHSDVGILWCDYVLNESDFVLRIWCSLSSEQLPNYKCVAKLSNPVSGHTVRKTLPVSYNKKFDWQWIINKEAFLIYVNDNTFDMQIKLIKNNHAICEID